MFCREFSFSVNDKSYFVKKIWLIALLKFIAVAATDDTKVHQSNSINHQNISETTKKESEMTKPKVKI
jgi:hypothetical protein